MYMCRTVESLGCTFLKSLLSLPHSCKALHFLSVRFRGQFCEASHLFSRCFIPRRSCGGLQPICLTSASPALRGFNHRIMSYRRHLLLPLHFLFSQILLLWKLYSIYLSLRPHFRVFQVPIAGPFLRFSSPCCRHSTYSTQQLNGSYLASRQGARFLLNGFMARESIQRLHMHSVRQFPTSLGTVSILLSSSLSCPSSYVYLTALDGRRVLRFDVGCLI